MNEPRQKNRSYDKNIVTKLWHESKVWVHLLILLTAAATAWQVLAGDVAAAARKNDQQDIQIEKISEAIATQAVISSRIEQKVDYIREDVKDIKKR